jgi:hypothetical protein
MKKIVISAQYQYLPDREAGTITAKGASSRLLTSVLLLVTGFILIFLWLSFPVLRVFLLVIVIILLVYAIYKAKGKI